MNNPLNIFFNFEKELKAAIKFVKNNNWKIKETPIIEEDSCSPIGAYIIYKNLPYDDEGTTIYKNSCKIRAASKSLNVKEEEVDSFLMGFYNSYGNKPWISKMFFNLGVSFRKEIDNV